MIGGDDVAASSNAGDGTPENQKAWLTYISEDLPRTVQESADSALRSARSLQHTSSTQVRSLQVIYLLIPTALRLLLLLF